MMNRDVKKFIIANTAVLLAAVAFIIYAIAVSDRGGHTCSFLRVTGMYCPGCGGTRAVFSLLRLDIVSAVIYNISVPFGLFVYIYYNVRWIIAIVKKDYSYFVGQKYILCIVLAIVIILNCIVKNILYLGFGIGF